MVVKEIVKEQPVFEEEVVEGSQNVPIQQQVVEKDSPKIKKQKTKEKKEVPKKEELPPVQE